jgi:hypothetical protein
MGRIGVIGEFAHFLKENLANVPKMPNLRAQGIWARA